MRVYLAFSTYHLHVHELALSITSNIWCVELGSV